MGKIWNGVHHHEAHGNFILARYNPEWGNYPVNVKALQTAKEKGWRVGLYGFDLVKIISPDFVAGPLRGAGVNVFIPFKAEAIEGPVVPFKEVKNGEIPMNQTKPKETPTYSTRHGVEPTYIRKLKNEGHTHDQIGDLLGCTGSHISQALRHNDVSKYYELAAKYVWSEQYGQPKKIVGLLTYEPEDHEYLQTVLQRTSAKVTFIEGVENE